MKEKFSRRSFLKVGGMAAVGTAVLPGTGFAAPAAISPAIALQLYTVRNELAKDIPGTLKRLASLGIQNVETAFWTENVTVKEAAEYIKDAGLKVCSSHIEIPVDEKSKTAMLETAAAYNCKRMIWHGWPEDKRYSSLEGTKELIGIYNEAGKFAKANGLEFGLHNHWWEYRNKVGGRFVYEWLLEGVDSNIFFEIDTYWVKVAGHDPAKIITQFGNRAKYLHMKDGPAKYTASLSADKPEPMVALGKGTQNIPAIAAAAKPNIEWMVIEMDVVATDVFEAIKKSQDYLIKNKFAVAGK
ncbi:sugar phosphate isomerase/epimerase [Panacibacter ginsenosidivorans]|uniref:Sugar phosphate isomerase/epimerase n=1 Tax=Panacibacter ginsenosidivorans TaxID=1813871 RepID=A0A5B8VGT8_9BACT|nr:TIM barrel protein [Panacibacter ginsenosidivorans]QEC70225.1 sugar phosphate isomerase/epimerase [Panacibacter ginsenosidivorans]